MHALEDLKMQLMGELEEYSRKKLTSETIKTIDTITHTIKNLCKIMESEEYSDASYRGGSYRGGSYNSYDGSYRGGSYDDGSYKRDSMGRYSREEGYSRNDAIVAKVAQMANNTPDERTRRQLQELAKELETV